MKKIIIALIVLVLTSISCGILSPDQPATGEAVDVDPGLLFKDDFSQATSGWDRDEWTNGLTDYADGVYRLYVKEAQYDIWSNPGKFFTGPVSVSVEATKVAGPEANDFGVICRYSEDDNGFHFYFLVIGSDGFVGIFRVQNSAAEELAANFIEEVINPGNTMNVIRGDCVDNTLTLYVNGVQALTATDSQLGDGDAGLIAGTFDEGGVDVEFDNFQVRRP